MWWLDASPWYTDTFEDGEWFCLTGVFLVLTDDLCVHDSCVVLVTLSLHTLTSVVLVTLSHSHFQ